MSTAATLDGVEDTREKGRPRNGPFYAVGGVAAVLFLPYLVPQRAVASDAYLFGYNNRAGVALLIVLTGAAAIRTRGFGLEFHGGRVSSRASRRALALCLAVQAIACLWMIRATALLGGFCESIYEIDRLWLLNQGRHPYTGFEWPFGPMFLYGPLWISRALHLSLAGGYYAFWTVASLGGVWLLFGAIQRLDFPTTRKTTIFVLLFVAFLPSAMGMGTHYTLLRFASPLYCILVVQDAAVRNARRQIAAGLGVLLTAVLLLISPEMAIAHAFACCVLLFPRRTEFSPGAVPASRYAAMVAGFVALFATANWSHLLDTLRASGGGADSFPVPLSFPVLFLFGVVFVCACYLVWRWRQGAEDNSVALIVVALPLLAAAMGRCDPGHILANGVGLILVVFLYASQTKWIWRLYCGAFVLAFMVSTGYGIWGLFMPLIRAAATENAAMRSGGTIARRAGLNMHRVPVTINFDAIYPDAGLGSDSVVEAPFGYMPNGFATYRSQRMEYGYYEGVENANTPAAIARKIDELAEHPERDLVLPGPSRKLCSVDGQSERLLLTVLFSFPYTGRVVHPESVHQPLCDYIGAHYSQAYAASDERFGYELWTPRSQRSSR